jgi:hypothetical protein
MAEAQAALGGFARVADAVKAGAFKRLYRDRLSCANQLTVLTHDHP